MTTRPLLVLLAVIGVSPVLAAIDPAQLAAAGALLQDRGKSAEAQQAFEKIAAADPSCAEAQRALAELALRRDEAAGTADTAGTSGGGPRPEGRTETDPVDDLDRRRDHEIASLKRRWQVALSAGLGLMAVMYVPIHLDTMDWLMPAIFVVATVVQAWAGADIYRAAWATARHGGTSMNTLVALGTGVGEVDDPDVEDLAVRDGVHRVEDRL